MAGKDYQIKLLLTAINNASPVIQQMIKDMNKAEKIDKKQRSELSKKTKEYESFWKKELDRRDKDAKDYHDKLKLRKKAESDQAISSRKKEVEYTSFWKKELDRRDKDQERVKNIELARIEKVKKEKEKAERDLARQEAQRVRNQRRQKLQRYTDLSHAQESARGAMLYVSTPAAANAAFAIRNAMTMEQLGIRMRTQFGKEEGMMAFEEMKNYAAQTAFRLEEAVQLLSGMKVGQKGLGISTTKELVGKSKSIGNVLLAFASSPEGRGEIAYQLSQVAMKRKANMRQDLMVMANYGLPIFEILEKYTGKTLEQLKDTYGAELPAELIFKVLDNLAKSPQVLQAMSDRTDSLSQSWDTLKERVFFTSSAYGEILDKQLGIKSTFKDASKFLEQMEAKMKGVSTESFNTKEQMIGFTTALVVGVPTLTFMLLTFKKLFTFAAMTAGSASALLGTFGLAAAAVSATYLCFQDWDKILKDIIKFGFVDGLLKHMDVLIASAVIFASLMSIALTGGTTLPAIAALVGGAVAYKKFLQPKYEELKAQEQDVALLESFSKSTPQMSSPSPMINKRIDAANTLYNAATSPSNMSVGQPIMLQIENNFKYDENGKVSAAKTSVKRNNNNNPISVIWGN